MGGIYGIRNNNSGLMVYVGKSKNLEKRRINHFWNARYRKVSGCRKLYSIMNKYGIENFSFIVIVDGVEDDSELRRLEGLYVRVLKTMSKKDGHGANLLDPWESSDCHSIEWKEKMVEAGKKRAANPDFKRTMQNRSKRPDWIIRNKTILQSLWKDEAFQRKYQEGIQKRSENKTWRANNLKLLKRLHEDPLVCQKRLSTIRMNHNREDYKVRMRELGERKHKPVYCIDTGELFLSMKQACEKYGLNPGLLSMVCNGKRSVTGGLRWRFATQGDINYSTILNKK